MSALREVVETRGVFCSLYSDCAGHFVVTPIRGQRIDPKRPTHVCRALQDLGIRMIPAYSPQARGRSERNSGHGRDAYRRTAITRYYQEIAPASEKGSAFVKLRRKDLDWIFSAQHEPTVNKANTVEFERPSLQLN